MNEENELLVVESKGDKGVKGSAQLDIYNLFKPLIKLYGDSYDIIKRAAFYSIIGSVVCNNKIVCSDIREDTRINLFVPLKSGYGKREIKEVIRRSIDDIGLNYCEPTSLHHEQLIGKTIRSVDGEIIPNRGHLSDDFLVFEEATELFIDKNNQESRDYIKIALDPIGYNRVYKKSVDTLKKDAVSYYPHCTIVFFFQPLQIDDTIVTKGLLRRGLIITCEPSKDERYAALEESFNSIDTGDNWNQWLSYLTELKDKEFNWMFDDDVKGKINELTIQLIRQGENKGKKGSSYTDIMFFTLRNLLVKMSCIQAAISNRCEVKDVDVLNAYSDLSVFWDIQLDFVLRKVKGDIDYLDITSKERECLLILQSNNCYSEEDSNLMIKDYINLIMKDLDCSVSTARYNYNKLVERGYVVGKQIGKYGSKVWLTDTGIKKVEPDKTLDTLSTLKPKASIFQRLLRK